MTRKRDLKKGHINIIQDEEPLLKKGGLFMDNQQ